MDSDRDNIYLIGFMGVGKSSVAAKLAELKQTKVMEMDQIIVEQQEMEIADIFAEYGDNYFRNLETDLLCEIAKKKDQVISCGGGVIVRPENVEMMKKNGCIILLTASPDTIYDRVKDSRDRPLLNENMTIEYIEDLMGDREERYEEAADYTVATDNKTVDEIAQEILKKIRCR